MPVHSRPVVLLTRPRIASERFALELQGIDVVIAPLMDIVGTDAAIDLRGIAGVILTSEAAVAFLPPSALPAYCVGPRTAEAAEEAGLLVRMVEKHADALVAALLATKPRSPLLHLHGQHQRGDIAERLTKGGLPTQSLVVYDQREVPPGIAFRAAIAREGLMVPLFSPRSATLFAEAAQGLNPTARLLAMSAAVADALPPHLRPRTEIIPAPTGAEMLRALHATATGGFAPRS